MRPWSYFIKDVAPYAPGCPPSIAEHAILRAAQDFCRQTRVWQLDLDATLTEADEPDYDIELEPQSEVIRLESATIGGSEIPVIPRTDRKPFGRAIYYSEYNRTITVKPTPGTAGVEIIVRASLYPSEDASGIEDAIFAQHVETIAMKAGAILQAQVGKPWSNAAWPTTTGEYQRQVDAFKTRLWRGMTASRPRAVGMHF